MLTDRLCWLSDVAIQGSPQRQQRAGPEETTRPSSQSHPSPVPGSPDNPPRGRNSKYFHARRMERFDQLALVIIVLDQRVAIVENETETRRLPVSQLFTSQNTIPLLSSPLEVRVANAAGRSRTSAATPRAIHATETPRRVSVVRAAAATAGQVNGSIHSVLVDT
jgi:hypothetical protein